MALILKGAKSVVLSLWNVDDAATALLMTRFYQNLLGRREGLDRPLPKAEALAQAKTWLRTRTAAEVERLCESLPTADRMEKVSGPPRSTAKNRPSLRTSLLLGRVHPDRRPGLIPYGYGLGIRS